MNIEKSTIITDYSMINLARMNVQLMTYKLVINPIISCFMKNGFRNTPTNQRLSATSGDLAHPKLSWSVYNTKWFGTPGKHSTVVSSCGNFEYLLGIKERGEVESCMVNEYLFK